MAASLAPAGTRFAHHTAVPRGTAPTRLRRRRARVDAHWVSCGLESTPATIISRHDIPARKLLECGDARIEVIAQGAGPLVLMLPSRGRGAEDFDAVAAGVAAAGYRVLCPQPRGAGRSTGSMSGITLHDLANDVAAVIRNEHAGPAVIVGHAFGNWVARMTAVDHPALVRGVVIAAAAAKDYPQGLAEDVACSADVSLNDEPRLASLRRAFFAPGHDARAWLGGWYPAVSESQHLAGKATPQQAWWPAGTVPLLDLQGELDPFKPRAARSEIPDELGPRARVAVIADASHALLPEQPAAVVAAILAWMRDLPPVRH
jgi:pimeloyl-ACP methyl ester carboxylesterase